MNRRRFIKSSAALGVAAAVGIEYRNSLSRGRAFAAGQTTNRKLPIPQLLESINERPIELALQSGEWEIVEGIKTPTIGFNGPYLGPTIRVRKGQHIPVTYRNHLSESVAIHAHGLHIPGDLDGGPQREIAPGSEWSLELPIAQQASTSWYHPHTHGETGRQTYQGLAGMFIIEDENSAALPLPNSYGVDDIPLIVQDRTLDSRGRLLYDVEDAEDGMMAETITVNGISNPIKTVPAGLVRFRILNGSNARYYKFRFSNDRTFFKIATDGGFLEEPIPLQELVMLPGERNEIIVDFSDGNSAKLISGPSVFARADDSRRDRDNRERRGERRNDWEPGGLNDNFEIMNFVVDPKLPAIRQPLPRQLNSIERPSVAGLPTRRFELYMEGGDRRRGLLSSRADNSEMIMGINGRPMDMNVINERLTLGQWERWQIRSNDGSHPFHVHGCSFLVISQDGRLVGPEDAGWKDTVRVDDSAEFIVQFNHAATEAYPFMYHCHILEHEDMGMMGQFTVT